MAACTSERDRRSGGCGTGTKTGQRQRESTVTEDWDEAQTHPQRALASPGQQHSALAAPRARDLTFGEWADFYLENFSTPPFRAPKTHEVNQRAMKHLRGVFEKTKLADLTADDIEMYLRERLKQRVQVKTGEWIRREAHAEGNNSSPGIASVAAHVERGRAQEVSVLRIRARVSSFRRGSMGCSGRTTWGGRSSRRSSSPRRSICSNVIRIVTETGLRIYKELDADEERSSSIW